MKYLFQLGREPDISIAETIEVLHQMKIRFDIDSANQHFLILNTQDTTDPVSLMNRLGGTVKIAAELSISPTAKDIAEYLNQNQYGKIVFSVSGEGVKSLGLEIKKILKTMDRSVRFVEPKNTATILHNNLVGRGGDLTIADGVFITRAIQPIEEWGERDYGRPRVDSKSGMLPPKLARMMINLSGADMAHDVLWDPFCGSGTILMEAAAMGFHSIMGSDISEKAVEDTKKNINWVKKGYDEMSLSLGVEDIRHMNPVAIENFKKDGVNVVVTEPYLGKPLRGNESKQWIQRQTEELKALYTDAFRVFQKTLPKNSIAVFIMPAFRLQKEWIHVDCISDIQKIGFAIVPFQTSSSTPLQSLRYHRPTQHLARDIWKFKKI